MRHQAIEKLEAAGFIVRDDPHGVVFYLSVPMDGRNANIGTCDIVGDRLRPFVTSALVHKQAVEAIRLA